jgi:hypothetical protein
MDKDASAQNKKLLAKSVSECFSSLSAVKKASSWYIRGDDNLAVINVQKSQWRIQYYINMSIFLGMGPAKSQFPPYYQGDIRIRLDQILSEPQRLQIQRALDFDTYIDENERSTTIKNAVNDSGLPMIRSMLKYDDVLKLKKSGLLGEAFISPNASIFFQSPLA